MAMNKTVFCLLLISLFLTSSLASNKVGEAAIGLCREKAQQQAMVEKCWAYIRKGESSLSMAAESSSNPSTECCDAMKLIHEFNCFCELNQYPHKWDVDMDKVNAAVAFCTWRKDLGVCVDVQTNN